MSSFYGGNPGYPFVISSNYKTYEDLINDFKLNTCIVNFGEYAIVSDPGIPNYKYNGFLYRRKYDGSADFVGCIKGPVAGEIARSYFSSTPIDGKYVLKEGQIWNYEPEEIGVDIYYPNTEGKYLKHGYLYYLIDDYEKDENGKLIIPEYDQPIEILSENRYDILETIDKDGNKHNLISFHIRNFKVPYYSFSEINTNILEANEDARVELNNIEEYANKLTGRLDFYIPKGATISSFKYENGNLILTLNDKNNTVVKAPFSPIVSQISATIPYSEWIQYGNNNDIIDDTGKIISEKFYNDYPTSGNLTFLAIDMNKDTDLSWHLVGKVGPINNKYYWYDFGCFSFNTNYMSWIAEDSSNPFLDYPGAIEDERHNIIMCLQDVPNDNLNLISSTS